MPLNTTVINKNQ